MLAIFSFLIGNDGTVFNIRGWVSQGRFFESAVSFGFAFMGSFGMDSSKELESYMKVLMDLNH